MLSSNAISQLEIMKSFNFTSEQKAAIVSVLIEMVNIDGTVAYEELVRQNFIHYQLQVDDDIFELGRSLKYDYAVKMIATMADDQKMFVAKLLIDIIDADDEVNEAELALLNDFCARTGVEKILK